MHSDFLNSASYDESPAFSMFLSYSNAKKKAADKIIKLFKPKRDWVFLDVGCGTGDMTALLANHVGRTVAVEPSSRMVAEFKKKFGSQDNVKLIQKRIEEVDFSPSSDKFDLILVAHVLYFIEDWDALFDKLLSALKPGGFLAVVMHARSGMFFNFLDRFQKLINKDVSVKTYLDAVNALKKKSLKPGHSMVDSKIVFPGVEEALSLSHFFFEKPFEALDETVKDKLTKHFRSHRKGKKVVFTSKQAIVWVQKPF